MQLIRDRIIREIYMVSKVCGMMARGDLSTKHAQQRKPGQWSKKDRDNFILSVLLNEDFDPLKICEQVKPDGVILWLIDGLQRATIIEEYRANMFELGKNLDYSEITYQEAKRDENGNIVKNEYGETLYENVACNLVGKYYRDLPPQLQENFDNCPVNVVKHLNCTDKELGRHIDRYNRGMRMNVSQRAITYMYNIARDIKRLSSHDFFFDCANYSDTKDKKGVIDKIVAEAIMGINFLDNWNKKVDSLGQFLNENATKEMFDSFCEELSRIYEIVTPEIGKLFTEKDAMIWFILFHNFLQYGVDDSEFGRFLSHIDELKTKKVKVENCYKQKDSDEKTDFISFEELDAHRSTKDKRIIVDKIHILTALMEEFLGIQLPKTEEKCNIEPIIEEEEENNQEMNSNQSTTEDSVLDFIRENVNEDLTEEDLDEYYELIDYCKDHLSGFNKESKLLDWQNETALVAIIAYSQIHEIDIDKWIVDFSNREHTYADNAKENYTYMLNSLLEFTMREEAA